MWPSMVTILGICALHLTHPSARTHTVVNTHPEQWVANAAAPREQLGVQCLARGTHLSRGIEGRERIHSPHPKFLPDLRLEPATLGLQIQLSNH